MTTSTTIDHPAKLADTDAGGSGGRMPSRSTAKVTSPSEPSTTSPSTSRGRVHRRDGSVGLRQVHPRALPGRPRHPHLRRGRGGWRAARRACRRRSSRSCARDRIGFVFQSFNLIPTLTALENIKLPADLAGRRLDAGLARHGDRHRRASATASSTVPSELSGGQQQRVAVARSLAGSTRDRVRRRADRQPRQPSGRRDPRVPAAGRRRLRPDRRDGDPRPQRRRLQRPCGLHGRRPSRRRDGRSRPPSECSTG